MVPKIPAVVVVGVGSVGSPFLGFWDTKAHFSSNGTARVSGGTGHQLVVGVSGVRTGQQGQPCDGILVDPHQAGGRSDPAALGELLQDRQDLVVRQSGVEERRPLELGEAGLAGRAGEQAVAGLGEVIDDEEVARVPPAVRVAAGIRAAEAGEVVVVRGPGASGSDP